MSKDEFSLSIHNLNLFSGETRLLHQVALDIKPGEILGLVGESGSGKTITSLSIIQLLQKSGLTSTGSIRLKGIDRNVLDLSEHELQKVRGNHVSMIFQEPMTALNPLMTCGNQVKEIIVQHRKLNDHEAKSEVLQLFEQVRLPDPSKKYSSYPHQLSGGQKQRVMIAMALANKPSLIIADEPTTALDVTVQAEILHLIRDIVREHQAGLLFISHDLAVVSSLCDRIAVIYRGEIVEEGDSKALMEQPKHPYTRALLACRPAAHKQGQRLPVVADFLGNDSRPQHKTISTTQEAFDRPTDAYLLEVSKLTKSYASGSVLQKAKTEYLAVNEVSFRVRRGETLGLVGESGCGKTTLSRCLLMLIPPDSGSIRFQGEEITTLHHDQLQSWRKKVQIIFQDPYSSLNPRLAVGRAISEAMLFHKIVSSTQEARLKVQDLLVQVGLKPEHYHRYPHEFSGGQRQRICIARALSVEPEFIICDESVSALDVSVQAQILNLLNDLKSAFGLSYLFISHDLSVVRYMSNRIMVMQKGQIVEEAPSNQLFEHPKTDYTKKLIAAIPKLQHENNYVKT
jgi:peptide/nickel transport system ATP-binding protein